MYLSSTQQISADIIQTILPDIFVGASGFEQRATYSIRFLDLASINHKFAFGFQDRKDQQRSDNDQIFQRNGIELVESDGNTGELVMKRIHHSVEASGKESLRIFIDYSCMTRSWYAAIISGIQAIRTKKRIECFFCYSPAVFQWPPPPPPNESVSPIPGFGGLDAIDRPSALVIGLGYEKDRAMGLLEYVDPAACFAFITDPPLEERYLQVIRKNNASFLDLLNRDNQYRHPLNDLQRTSNLLLSLVWGLKDQYRVILAPLGVKPFSLLCLLLAARYPEMDVWRVTSGTKAGTSRREALGPLLILRADFTGESEHHAGMK